MFQIASSFPGWRHLAAGQLLWNLAAERQANDELAKEVSFLLGAGELVPAEVVVDLLVKALKSTALHSPPEDKVAGFLISGFPRDISQARIFQERVSESSWAEAEV